MTQPGPDDIIAPTLVENGRSIASHRQLDRKTGAVGAQARERYHLGAGRRSARRNPPALEAHLMGHTVRAAPLLAILALMLLSCPSQAAAPPDRLLYFTLSAGFKHDVIPLSHEIAGELGETSGAFSVTVSEDVDVFSPETLRGYAAVMFYTTGELPMNGAQKAAFLDFVRSGHGFVGVHSATDTFYLWPEYLELVGGYFDGHPWRERVTLQVADPGSPLVSFLRRSPQLDDEIYQIRDFDWRRSRVLLRLDPTSVDLTRADVHRRAYGWPLAWTRSYGKGRVFYTALGHNETVWRDPRYQRLLLNGIRWSMRRPA
jgi:type 1 glutamine amidotransferase